MNELTLTRPDDWHLHLRDGAALQSVVAYSARQFARAIVMPNLKPAVTTAAQAAAYRDRILRSLPSDTGFNPLMTLYLTDRTSAAEIERAKTGGIIFGVKLYPAGATTHSDEGVTDLARCYGALERMEALDLPLLVHGEVTNPQVDVFDREARFIEEVLIPLRKRFPKLKVVFEHITTKEAVDYIKTAEGPIAATVTPHHMLYNRSELFRGGIRPHVYCLPVLKREKHRRAVLEAAISGHPRFFLGTDSAPHARHAKEASCGCAGIYSAHAAMELYATVFERAGALDRLEAFAGFHGPDFYDLPRNADKLTLKREEWQVPAMYPFGENEELVPMCAGERLGWRVV